MFVGVFRGLFVVLIVEKSDNCDLSCFKEEEEEESKNKEVLVKS